MTKENKLKFAKLERKLDGLMKADKISDMDEKLVPYLGWWWREIGPDYPSIRMSWLEGHWWIDECGKWAYPSKTIGEEEAIALLEQCIKVAELGPEGIDSDERKELIEMLKKNPPEGKG